MQFLNYYFFQENTNKSSAPLEPVLVQCQLHPSTVRFPDKTEIRLLFDIQPYKFADIIFCRLDPRTRDITPIPWEPPSGSPLMDPAILAAADAKTLWLQQSTQQLSAAIKDIYDAIKAGRVTEILLRGLSIIRQAWVENAANTTSPIDRFNVNFTESSPFWYTVELRADPKRFPTRTKAFVDGGAGISLITPAYAKQIGLIPVRPALIGGITDGDEEGSLARIHVTLKPGVAGTHDVVIYPPLRRKVKADFLLGRNIIRFAKKHRIDVEAD